MDVGIVQSSSDSSTNALQGNCISSHFHWEIQAMRKLSGILSYAFWDKLTCLCLNNIKQLFAIGLLTTKSLRLFYKQYQLNGNPNQVIGYADLNFATDSTKMADQRLDGQIQILPPIP